MNHIEIQKAVWEQCQEFIGRGEDMETAPLYVKITSVFNDYRDQSRWKNPFTAVTVTEEQTEWLKAAVVWFHGCQPIAEYNSQMEIWRVTSVGYSC